MSALIGGITYLKTENLLLVLAVCVGIAVLVALTDSVLANVFHLPVFVTTIAMLSVLNALVLLLISMGGTGSEIAVPMAAVRPYDTTLIKLCVLGGYFAICLFFFEFTAVGRRQKYLGGNPKCAKLTGISLGKYSIIAFVLCGIGVGLGAFLSIIYSPTLTGKYCIKCWNGCNHRDSFRRNACIRWWRSRIWAAIVGAFSMSFLGQIMVMLNFNSGVGQIVKAVIFLLVVFVASGSTSRKTLPR